MEVIMREDGRFEKDGRLYARADGFPQFGLPGWRISLRMKELTLHRHYTMYGGKNGDLRPPLDSPRFDGLAKIDGFNNRIGVLGHPETENQEVAVSFYLFDEGSLGTTEIENRCRNSWPTSLTMNKHVKGASPWSIVVHIPRRLFQEIVEASSSGRIDSLRLDVMLSGLYVLDYDRPNGQEEGWTAYVPPSAETRLKTIFGYISGLYINERTVQLPLDREEVPDAAPLAAILPVVAIQPKRGKLTPSILFWALFGLIVGLAISLLS